MLATTSKVLKEPLLKWFKKTGTTKRAMAKAIGTSNQSPTDWTSDKPKKVTADNAVRIADFANDSELTLDIVYQFFGVFRPLDGDTYRKDLSTSDDLREIEENERDQTQELAQRVLLKQVQKLDKHDYELLLKFSKEQAEAVFANIQYLNALCEVQNISIKDLFEIFMNEWQEMGYFKEDAT